LLRSQWVFNSSYWKERTRPPMAVLGGEYPIRWFRSTLIGLSEQGSTLAPGYGTEAFKLTST
jgi:hypothetical protein